MRKLQTTTRFEKDYKKAAKSGRDLSRLKQVMTWLACEQELPPALRDHKLVGNYHGRRWNRPALCCGLWCYHV